MKTHHALSETKAWVTDIIVGLNFCPFAKKELVNNTIYYHLSVQKQIKNALEELIEQCRFLQQHDEIETLLIVYDKGFVNFSQYLDLLAYGDDLLADSGFEGVFQIASFHPNYCFEGENHDDAANFTNRSPYPMLHLIREASMEKVLKVYNQPELIPDNNIELARSKGSDFFIDVLKNIKGKHSN